jgi:transcriptional regulator with XRE-family HTH domain
MNIGHIIARARAERGITQRDLADRMGCSPTAIGIWETGGKMPSVKNRLIIAEVLGIPISDVIPEFAGEPGSTEYVTEPDLVGLIRRYRALPPPARRALHTAAEALQDALAELTLTPP